MNTKIDQTWNLFYSAFQNTYVYDGVHIYKKSKPNDFIEGSYTICLKIKQNVGKAYRATRIAAQILGLPLEDSSRVTTISDDKTDLSRANLAISAIGQSRYAIDNDGRLVNRVSGESINGYLNPVSGYMQVMLYKNGRQNTTYAHRVIWELANGAIPNGYVIDHIDGNRTNNILSNLQLVSIAHNGHKRVKAKGLYFGVTTIHNKNSTSYAAVIAHNGYTHHIGRFSSILFAAYAYDVAAKFFYDTVPNNVKDRLPLQDRKMVEAYVTPKLVVRTKMPKPRHGYVGVNFAPRDGVVNYNAIITDVDGKTYTMGRYTTADDAAYAANKGNEVLGKKVRNVLPVAFEPSEGVQIAVDRGIARLIAKKPRKNIQKAA